MDSIVGGGQRSCNLESKEYFDSENILVTSQHERIYFDNETIANLKPS